MAITSDQLQTALGTGARDPQVLQAFGVFGTTQQWYIKGGVTYPGRHKYVSTTAADDAATQAAAVVTALLSGPA